MNLFQCTESAIVAEMEKHAFNLNILIQNQASENCRENFSKALGDYAACAAKMEVLNELKSQISSMNNPSQSGLNENENKDDLDSNPEKQSG